MSTVLSPPSLPVGRPALGQSSRSSKSKIAREEIAGPLFNSVLVLVLLLIPIGLMPIVSFLPMVACAGAAFSMVTLLAIANVRIGNQQDMSGFLVVPLLLSAFQNVYLGVMAPYSFSFYIQMALMTHIAFAAMLLISYFFAREPRPLHPLLIHVLIVALGIFCFAVVSVVAFHTSVISMVISARNMLSPLLFLMIGLLLAERAKLSTFLSLVAILAWITIFFGFVEYLSGKNLWFALNIEQLWFKKGLHNIAEWGLPANFVSSEKFFGEQIRRMVSSYADPVNFGTVLFLFFMVAWFTKRWILVVMCLVAITLAVSKGAVMGLLIFFMVSVWRSENHILRVFGVLLAAAAGVVIILYTLTHSTQSLAAHVRGLWTAIASLPEHPLGRGLGGAGMFAENKGDLKESGLGLIIGQLGLMAFVIFGAFFYGIWRWISRLSDPRQNILGCTIFLGLFANIAFNEVALSPNSSAGYFLLLGLLIATDWHLKQGVPSVTSSARVRFR